MMAAENIVNTLALALVCLSCFMHLNANVDRHSSEVEAWGFILTGAGAFGMACAIWWTRMDVLFVGYDTIMHVGMALIAIWLVAGKIRAWLAHIPGLEWTERRQSRATK